MTDQLPPASIEAEEALLGGILFDPRLIVRIKKTLPVEAFYVGSHQTIYQSMIFVHKNGYEPNLIHISTYLDGQGVLDTVGGMAKLSQLLNRTVSASNCDGYAALILEKYKRRRLISIGSQIKDLGYDQTQELEEIYEEVRSLLSEDITPASQVKKNVKIKSVRYSLYNQTKTKKLEMEAEINENDNLIDDTTELEAAVKYTAEQLWRENS